MIKDNLVQGSFRGVQFNFNNAGRVGGRKSVFHTFPNSDFVQVEDLGRMPREFTIDMIIPGVGSQYFNSRNAMITALETPGEGELIHPLYGPMTVQISGAYDLNENIGSLGEARISQTFIRVDIDDREEVPSALTINNNSTQVSNGMLNTAKGITPYPGTSIYERMTELNSDIGLDGLGELPTITNDYLEGVNAIKRNITSISSKFTTIARLIQNPTDYSNYSELIRMFEITPLNEIADVIDGVGQLFRKGEEFVDDVDLWLRGIESTYDYNDEFDFAERAANQQRAEELANEEAFRNLMQVVGVAYAANAMINIDYVTDEQLQEESDKIMAQIDKTSDFLKENEEMFALLKQLKSNLREAIDQELLSVFQVETFTVRTPTPLTTIVHSLYGNLDNYDIIRDLNDFQEYSFIVGDIKVVTSG